MGIGGVRMQDRFKFRCFNRKTKKMYEVDSLHLDSKDGEWVWAHYYNPVYDKDLKIQIVQPHAILMQSTGLKDKNGKLIYEGDIITDGIDKYVVEWDMDEAYLRFCARANGTRVYYTFEQLLSYEVIGNIYENPELLED